MRSRRNFVKGSQQRSKGKLRALMSTRFLVYSMAANHSRFHVRFCCLNNLIRLAITSSTLQIIKRIPRVSRNMLHDRRNSLQRRNHSINPVSVSLSTVQFLPLLLGNRLRRAAGLNVFLGLPVGLVILIFISFFVDTNESEARNLQVPPLSFLVGPLFLNKRQDLQITLRATSATDVRLAWSQVSKESRSATSNRFTFLSPRIRHAVVRDLLRLLAS